MQPNESQGVTARWGLEEAQSKGAGRRTGTGYGVWYTWNEPSHGGSAPRPLTHLWTRYKLGFLIIIGWAFGELPEPSECSGVIKWCAVRTLLGCLSVIEL